jgi:hypothetical protein
MIITLTLKKWKGVNMKEENNALWTITILLIKIILICGNKEQVNIKKLTKKSLQPIQWGGMGKISK